MRLAYVLCAKNNQEIEALLLQIANQFIQFFPHEVWITLINKIVPGTVAGFLSFNLIIINSTTSPYKYHTPSYNYSLVGCIHFVIPYFLKIITLTMVAFQNSM
jgi:hypothetical protein